MQTEAMGDAFAKGMVLVMSLWDDYEVNMHWLNSPFPTDAPIDKPGVARGPCSITSGKPEDVERDTPGATVVFSNVRTGTLGSTYSGVLQPGGGTGSGSSSSSSSTSRSSSTTSRATTTTSRATTTTTRSSTTTTPAGGVAQKWEQCGVSQTPVTRQTPPQILTIFAGHQLERPEDLCQRLYLHQDQRLLLPVLVDGVVRFNQYLRDKGMARMKGMAEMVVFAVEKLSGQKLQLTNIRFNDLRLVNSQSESQKSQSIIDILFHNCAFF